MQHAVVVVALLSALTAVADAARYRGVRIDIYSGQQTGRWIIRTKPQGAALATTVVCKPRRRCGDLRRLRFTLAPDGSATGYTGSFRIGGGLVRCAIEASIDGVDFAGAYSCDDGTQGRVNGQT